MKPLQVITSAKNPRVLAAKALASARGRAEQQAFLCEGEHLVTEALAMRPQAIQAVFVAQGKESLLERLLAGAPDASLPPSAALYAVPEHVLSALSQVKAPQGIAAVVALPALANLESTEGLPALGEHMVFLENVQDPGNVGTILRTADAAGFTGCILAGESADPFSPKALRATMGSVFRLPLARVSSGAAAAQLLKSAGFRVIAAVLDGLPFYERGPLPPKVCLLIGNEGAGLSKALSSAATHRYALPMRGGAESLNAAVAAAIMMYDIVNRG
ncbi:MAG: RNA methyltransferase [Clostridiales bacterium]|nr:RNA methyltransferase [Clostridiales bacterium]